MEHNEIITKAYNGEVDTNDPSVVKSVLYVLDQLDKGNLRVAQKQDDKWHTNEWAKQAILLYFKITKAQLIEGGALWDGFPSRWYDKWPQKFTNWQAENFDESKIRASVGSIVRYSAYLGANTVLMPSFINVGAYVDEGTMIDSWSTIGSCAQIGKRCHISGGVGIGGVLEPVNANPVIIEDDCFIGARSEIAEGVIVEKGAVISMGVFIGASTKIYNRETKEIIKGRVPAYSVVVPGVLLREEVDVRSGLYAPVIVKTVDAQTRAKTGINELLRD